VVGGVTGAGDVGCAGGVTVIDGLRAACVCSAGDRRLLGIFIFPYTKDRGTDEVEHGSWEDVDGSAASVGPTGGCTKGGIVNFGTDGDTEPLGTGEGEGALDLDLPKNWDNV